MRPIERQVERITLREREVLKYIANGMTLDEVADKLHITRNTVHTHVKHLYAKLLISSRAEAATIAARLGLIKL